MTELIKTLYHASQKIFIKFIWKIMNYYVTQLSPINYGFVQVSKG